MGQLTELVVDRTQSIPFQHEGKALKARPLPLRLALKMTTPNEDGEVTIEGELMAEIISECVLFEDGERVFTLEQILDGDSDLMLPLFKAVTGLFEPQDAAKNSKASRP